MDERLYHDFFRVEREHWWFVARRRILISMLNGLLPHGKTFLDIGCGTGYFLEQAALTYTVTGLDASEIAVRMCRERGLKDVHYGSAEALSAVEGRSFHGLGFFDVIEHLDDDVGALERAKALLTPDGVVIITVPAYPFMWSRHDELNHHKRRYTRLTLTRAISSAGLKLKYVSYFNFLLFPLAFAVRQLKKRLGKEDGDEFALPSPVVNRVLERLFQSERSILSGRHFSFPYGLSLLAIATLPPSASTKDESNLKSGVN